MNDIFPHWTAKFIPPYELIFSEKDTTSIHNDTFHFIGRNILIKQNFVNINFTWLSYFQRLFKFYPLHLLCVFFSCAFKVID